ncbi:MAG: PQQ-binding-like beta-propeller repeat protein, partial [Phycisphaerae bacterium]
SGVAQGFYSGGLSGLRSPSYAYQDWIILPIGGEGQAVMAFRQKDGEVAWKNQDFPSTFATPFVSRVGGESQLIVFVDKAVAGLDPSNGELKWRHEHPTQFGANISTPVLSKDGCIFIASAYNMGSRGIRLVRHDGRTVPEEMWYNRKMQIHFGNAIRIGDHVYGSSAFMGPAFFACVDMKTGEFAWKERGIGKASCVYGDGKMIILAEDGNLFLTSVGPERIRIHSKFQACESNAWTVPTLVGRTLFVRDRKSIMALDLG